MSGRPCLSRPSIASLAVILTLAIAAPAGAAATLCVKPGGGSGCSATISAALALANPGDTIRVVMGTYVEYVAIDKDVTLEGGWNGTFTTRDPVAFVTTVTPPDATFSVVSITGGAPTLDGFTITGGGGGNHGGGLRLRDSNAVVRRNVITGNTGYLYGGGVWVQRGAPRLEANRINGNYVNTFGATGAGVSLENSQAVLISNYIAGNHFVDPGGVGGGVSSDGTVRMINNTLEANDVSGVAVLFGTLTLVNNIIVGHPVGLDKQASGTVAAATTNDFFNNTANTAGYTLGPGNLTVDPLLLNGHLQAGSPMIDAGTRTPEPDIDVDAQPRFMAGVAGGPFRVDIGADEYTGAAQRIHDLDTGAPAFTLIGPGNASATSNGPNDWIGYSVLADDITGDGRADLLTSAEDWAEDFDNPPHATGRTFGLFNFGSRVTGTRDLLTSSPDLDLVCGYNLQHIGSDLVSGDLNGDGTRDLIAGSFEDDNAGGGTVTPTVFALWGGPSLAGVRPLNPTSPPDFALQAPGQDFFSFASKGALATGDLDADGVADLIVGDRLANHGAVAGTGAVFVMFGSAGLAGLHDLGTTPADYTLYGATAAAGLGAAAVGRVNGDGLLDLVARTDTTAYVRFGPLSAGSDTTAAADVTITGLTAADADGGRLLVADVTGDGQDDLILGSGADLLVVPGPLGAGTVDVSTAAVLTLAGAQPSALAFADVAGDPRPDLIVGSKDTRQVFVIAGGVSAIGVQPALDLATTIVKGLSISNFGWDVAAGDLDHDFRADIVVGSRGVQVPSHPAGYQDAGTTYVVYSKSNDAIFANGFELGNLAAWSAAQTDGGDLSADAAAGLASSSVGLKAVVNDTAGLYVEDDTPQDERRYRARFYFDPNGFDPGEGSAHFRTRLFIAFEENPTRRLLALVLRRQGGQYSLRARARQDDNSQVDTAFFGITDAPHAVEVDWQRSSTPGANDGSLRLWIDGTPVATVAGLDNNRSSVDFVRMGALNVKPGANGTMYWDEFVSRRESYIGP